MNWHYQLCVENGNEESMVIGTCNDIVRAISVTNKLQDIIDKLDRSTAQFSVWETFCGDETVSALVYKASRYMIK